MSRHERLLSRQQRLKDKLNKHLNLLIGSVVKSPAQSGYYLTTKVNGTTVTRYVRQEIIERAKTMTRNHQKVRELLRRLSAVNWELLRETIKPAPRRRVTPAPTRRSVT